MLITMNWDGVKTGRVDVRLFYNDISKLFPEGKDFLEQGERGPKDWTTCRWPYIGDKEKHASANVSYPWFYTHSG